ncbi:MAG: NAD(P)-binding domain-containing protein [Methanocella sp.]|jgi:nucleotide sugar dehydrogenase
MAKKSVLNRKQPKTIIIGLGEIGYHNAEYMTQLGLDVEGYDINPQAVQRALQDGVIKAQATNFRGYDYYMICVSTHNPKNMYLPFLEGLLNVAEKINIEAKPGALVIIESTITKGISQEICTIFDHKLHVAHAPHRYFSEEKEEHGVKQLRVIGGCHACCLSEATYFYSDILNIPLHPVESIEIAELTKVVENTHRFLEIAFAEELKMFCHDQALNFDQLREAVNTKWNENLLEAREGIGGHCLPKDTQMFYELSKHLLPNSTIAAAIQSDIAYTRFISGLEISAVPLNQAMTVPTCKKKLGI